MAAVAIDDLNKRSTKAWSRKSQWDTLYRDVYRYMMPQRNQYDTPQDGAQKGIEVFDSTGVQSLEASSNRLQSNMCPPFQRWLNLESGPGVKSDFKTQLNQVLQQVTDRFFAVIDTSNYASIFSEFAKDLMVGTGLLFVEEETAKARRCPVRFTAVAPIEVALEEGPNGTVEGYFRKHRVAPRLITRTWRDAKMTEELTQKANDNSAGAGEDLEFQECTYYDDDAGVWWYVVWLGNDENVIVERKYQECPWVCCRWSKASNEVYGRGPAVSAIYDVKTLNKVVELILKNASLAISGAYTVVDDGVTNPNGIVIRPGAMITVGSNGGNRGPSVAPLKAAAEFDVAGIERDDLRMTIKKMLFDQQLPPDTGPVRSATEIAARMKELVQDIGAAFGRLQYEFIQPLVQRVLGIMYRAGLFNDLDDVMSSGGIKITGYLVNVKVTSPIARLQNSEDVSTVMNWLALMGQLGPEIAMLGCKVEDLPEWLGQKLGVPAELIRTGDNKAELVKAVQQMMAQAMAAQQAAANANQPPASQPAPSPASQAA